MPKRQTIRRKTRPVTTAALELAGCAAVVWAMWDLAPWLGKFAAGIVSIVIAFAVDPRARGES